MNWDWHIPQVNCGPEVYQPYLDLIKHPLVPFKAPILQRTENKSAKEDATFGSKTQLLTKKKILEMIKKIDSTLLIDDQVEKMFIEMTEDFVESAVNGACLLAKHSHGSTVEVKDIQLHLQTNFNIFLPDSRVPKICTYKRPLVTEAHKQRLALIHKSLKKY